MSAPAILCPVCGSDRVRYQHCKIFCLRCGQLIMSCNESV